jgi:hypothetical protein
MLLPVKREKAKPTSVTGNSTVCFAAGFTVISVTASAEPNSPSLLSPPYFTGICSAAMYLLGGKKKFFNSQPKWYKNACQKATTFSVANLKSFSTNLIRVSADLEGPTKTNLLLVLWVKNGLIILFTVRYHQGTLMKICRVDTKESNIMNLVIVKQRINMN